MSAVAALHRLWAKARSLFGNREDSEFQAEMAAHLESLTQRFVREGMSPADAGGAAARQFGNITLLQEERNDMQTFASMEALWQDLRYGWRMLLRDPSFTCAVTLMLALGIGANTAIFSVYDAVMLKPPPYAEPERVVMLWEKRSNGELSGVAPANFVDWRTQAGSFSEMAAIERTQFILTGSGEPTRLEGAAVSANFFRLLGTRTILGRHFVAEEDQPGRDRAAVISHKAWQNQLGRNPGILGTSIRLNDLSYTVVGVLGPEFELATSSSADQPQIWVPLALNLAKLHRGTHPLRVFARLKAGVDLSHAQAEVNVVAANLANLYPADNKDKGITAVPLVQHITQNFRVALTTLLGGVGLLLLIACANVANLLLSRSAARQKEMAVRLALGASRHRIGQQLLTESLLLSVLGGTAGLIVAFVSVQSLSRYLPADLPGIARLTIDVRVLAFTAAISLATGILFGLAPLQRAFRENSNDTLKQSSRTASAVRSRLRSGLVVTQIALALILLTGAALTGKSLWNLLQVSPGFRTEHILTARVPLPASRYPDARQIAAFQHSVLDKVRNMPGIQSAGMAAYLPLSGADNAWAVTILGRPPLPIGVYNMPRYRPVSPGYFETIGIPVLRGRAFANADTEDSPLVVVINESMARTWWGQENPVGQRIRYGGPTPRTIVGVVGDVRHQGLDADARPEMYAPFSQIPNPERRPALVVRTTVGPAAVAASLRRSVSEIDSALPVDQVETMEQLADNSLGQPRFRTILLAAFSGLALVISSIGIYGVLNYLVSQRSREFGIRVALGATQGNVCALVLRQAVILILVGLAAGLIGSVMFARLITGLLYGVTASDPTIIVVVSLALALVALLASYIPARRATKVDPLMSLRCE